jgi:hypothetical protein
VGEDAAVAGVGEQARETFAQEHGVPGDHDAHDASTSRGRRGFLSPGAVYLLRGAMGVFGSIHQGAPRGPVFRAVTGGCRSPA